MNRDNIATADPDLELRGDPGFVLIALPAFLLSVISSFLPKIRGAQALDPPLPCVDKSSMEVYKRAKVDDYI